MKEKFISISIVSRLLDFYFKVIFSQNSNRRAQSVQALTIFNK